MILSLCMTVYLEFEFQWPQHSRMGTFVGYLTVPERVRRQIMVNTNYVSLSEYYN